MEEPDESRAGLDSFTRRYLLVLSCIVLIAALWWIFGGDSRVRELNDVLGSDTELADYPYPFRVISLQNGVAELSSPRAAGVPVIQFLRTIHPELRNRSVLDPAVEAAQARLVEVQTRAARLVREQEGIKGVRWTLDEDWFAAHGVILQ